ncbi:MFS family permease [Kineosporia succinea]|uniref:MFS family permease n=1 Tax=Kineosporia succinea TaxID=84632 RepID=A0ABT9PBF9_9ACTN|nr:MFS transporter [Kineosporia succinea]MDP9830044.1 MFS family permease [Kineosporia succinea]
MGETDRTAGTSGGHEEVEPPRGDGTLLRGAFLISSVGDWIYRFVAPFLILELTGSAVLVALAVAVELIPYILFGLVAGVVADMYDRRRIMIVCDLVSAVLATAIAVVAAGDDPSVGLVFALALVLAGVRPFYFPAFQGVLVTAVPQARRSRVNAWTQSVDSLLSMLGPVVGAAFVAALGVRSASVVNAVTFVLSALMIRMLTLPATTLAVRRTGGRLRQAGRDFAEGFRTLWSIPAVAWGTLLIAAANLAGYMVESNIVYFVIEVENHPAWTIGVVVGIQGAGALAGAALSPRVLDRYPPGQVLTVAMAISAAGMLVPALHPSTVFLSVGWCVEGAATSLVVVSWFTLRQNLVPNEQIGRIVSVGRALAYSTIPVGSAIGGALIGSHPTSRLLFVTALLVQLGVCLATYLSPLRTAPSKPPENTEPQAVP